MYSKLCVLSPEMRAGPARTPRPKKRAARMPSPYKNSCTGTCMYVCCDYTSVIWPASHAWLSTNRAQSCSLIDCNMSCMR